PNQAYVPEIASKTATGVVLMVDNKVRNATNINQILSTYTIKGFYDFFSTSSNSQLRNKYIIDVGPTDNLDELVRRFPSYFKSVEKEEEYEPLETNIIPDVSPINTSFKEKNIFNTSDIRTDQPVSFTPNDWENPDLVDNVNISNTIDEYEQNDLRMIRARQAWAITKGRSQVVIGIADQGFDAGNANDGGISVGLDPGHEDLASEFVGGLPNYNDQYGSHGNYVAGFASAATNNDLGVTAIGYKTKMIGARGLLVSNLLGLAQYEIKPKVVNGSFGSGYGSSLDTTAPYFIAQQAIVNDIDDLGVTVVFAAGNGGSGLTGDQDEYYLPASYKNVISVSTVGNKHAIGSTLVAYDNWKDVHDIYVSELGGVKSHQHNDSVDIVVPAYYPTPVLFRDPDHNDPWKDDYRRTGYGGTSLSAPIVAGTIALMHSVNYCIDTREVETILKLTAVKIDHLPQNSQYYGRLGAGRLDAYEAVRMAKDMSDTYGIVKVKNRMLYRPWFYKLETSPYKIHLINNSIIDDAKIKFRARNAIEIFSGIYEPDGGYISLQVDPTISSYCPSPWGTITGGLKNETETPKEGNSIDFLVYPTLVKNNMTVKEVSKTLSMKSVRIHNIYGYEVYNQEVTSNQLQMDLSSLDRGIYILEILNTKGEAIKTTKFVKN
ncbi:MAG: hypothetical protein ACI9Y7_002795, partial [Dokdonia sp.]